MRSASLFRLLGDEARLRILRLLDAERLNVTELTSILGIAQSGVSRHLGLLKDAGLVEERRDAGFTFFRLAPDLRGGNNGFGPVWPLLRSHFDAAGATPEGRADEARLEEVRRVRAAHGEHVCTIAGPDAPRAARSAADQRGDAEGAEGDPPAPREAHDAAAAATCGAAAAHDRQGHQLGSAASSKNFH